MKTIQCDFEESYKFQFNLSLNNQGYTFTLFWNDILKAFFLDMVGNKIKYSIPLAVGVLNKIDTNVFVCIEKAEEQPILPLSIDTINQDYFLIFADEDDL